MALNMLYEMIFLLLITDSFLSLSNNFGVEGAGRILSKEEDLELERQLKILNKVPIKTIQTERGEIYDCIDIYKQPTLDHPLLKDHKIKLRPTSEPKVSNTKTSSKDRQSRVADVKRVDCPKGTVPIRRIAKDDLIRAKPFFESHSSSINDVTKSKPGQHLAVRRTKDGNGRPDNWQGVGGYINVANPIVPHDQFSSGQVWVESYLYKYDPGRATSIQAGWAVSPQLFGDNVTRLFVYSNKDEIHEQGCYSLHCLGFVQVNRKIPIGTEITTISVYKGQQYDIHVTIYKDPKGEGNWWLKSPYDNSWMGYWPDKLFPDLHQGANAVGWGGMVRGTPNGLSPQMGNGEFPNHHYDQASYIMHLSLPVPSRNETEEPYDDPEYFETFVDHPECYSLEYSGFLNERSRVSFMFGGPGGANCGP